MTKTLREELCEICGIVPKQKACIHYDRFEQCCVFDKCDDIDCPYRPPLIYPDFTKPENLVKLLEIMTDTNNIAEKVLLQTIEILSTESEIGLLVCVKKQAIREAEWDWE